VDGESEDPGEAAGVEAHLRACESCRVYAEAEAATKSLVGANYRAPVDVTGLLAGVRERRIDHPAPRRRDFSVRGLRLAWGAIAAAVLFALAIGGLMLRPQRTVEASPLVRAAVTDHVECMLGRLPLELTATDQDEVARWLRRRLAQPVVLPAVAGPGEHSAISTRMARLGDVESSQILFDRDGRMLSLFIMTARQVSGVPGRRLTREGREFFVDGFESYKVVFWRSGDLIYCLVGDGEEANVLSLAAEYAGSARG
jgi:anti-sigma factor RsiW